RIIAANPAALNARQSRNENHRTPLQFAVLKNRPEMVSLLIAQGADPLAVDGSGQTAAAYATTSKIDQRVMEKIRVMTRAELISAARGNRTPRSAPIDLLAVLAMGDWETAAHLVRANRALIDPTGGVLHLMAKRDDAAAVKWLLDHGADPNGRWAH